MLKFHEILKSLRKKGSADSGAGGLLPVIVVGMLIVMAAASITSAVGLASNTSKAQRDISEATIENDSLLQEFEAQALSYNEYKYKLAGSLPTTGLRSTAPRSYEGDDGAFKVYVSSSETQPTGLESSGVNELAGNSWGDAKWILVETTPKDANGELSDKSEVAIYKAYNNLDDSTGSRSYYAAINTLEVGTHTTTPVTKTTINVKNGSTIDAVSGVTRNPVISDKNTKTGSTNQTDWNITDSTVHADFASRSGFLTMKNSKAYGDLRSLSGGLSMTNNSVFYGNACSQFFSVNSGSERVGNATAGDCATNYFKEDVYSTTRYIKEMSDKKISVVTAPADACSNFNSLKSFMESLTTPSIIAYNCASSPNNVLADPSVKKELNLKTRVVLGIYSGGISNLTINGLNDEASLTLQFATAAAMPLNDSKLNLPTLFITMSADTTIKNTEIIGQIVVYNAKSRLVLDNSTLSYVPMDARISGGNVPMDLLRVA